MGLKGFRDENGNIVKYEYNALEGSPTLDTTLEVSGAIPDSKTVGDKIKATEDDISGLKADLSNSLTYDAVGKKIVITLPETA